MNTRTRRDLPRGARPPPERAPSLTCTSPSRSCRSACAAPPTLLRLLATLAALGAVILLALVAKQTLYGLERDVTEGTTLVPLLSRIATFIGGAAVLIVPVAFAVERVFHRDGLRVAEGLIAAIIGMVGAFLTGQWLLAGNADDLSQLLTGGRSIEPLNTLLTSVLAYTTAVRVSRRPTWRALMWTVIALYILALYSGRQITLPGAIVTVLVGMAIGYATLYGIGSPNTRPPGNAVVAALRKLSFAPVSARRIEDDHQGSRRYSVGLADGARIDVTVLDRDRQVAGLPYRLWRRFRLSTETRRRAIRSLRAELEREALMAYAAQAAGASTPRLLGTSEIGTEAALLVYEHIDTRPLDEVPTEEIDDDILHQIWEQVSLLQIQRLAHRRLTGEGIHLDKAGRVVLTDARSGEIAAGDLLLRLDIAQLLVYLSLRVGAERSVRAANAVMGTESLAAAMPLLQRIALTRETRSALAKDKNLLGVIREQIVALEPEVKVEEMRLERFRPRTLVTIIASTLAAYFLLSQLSQVNLVQVVVQANWAWSVLALVASFVSFVAAAVMLRGFVPYSLPLWRTTLVQFAASFVKLVAPAAVGGVAINTRYLQKRGIAPALAVASVGASQLVMLAFHIGLLLLFAYITGSNTASTFTPSRGLVVALLAVALLVVVLLGVPPLRRLVTRRMKRLFSNVLPRLLDVLQSPRKLIEGSIGTLLITLTFVLCLYACVHAFNWEIGFTTVAVVYLTANAIGSAAPTPGGLGAVELSLTAGLTVAGVPAELATSAVLLYRLLTFWLPVLPGWAAFTYLQRHEAL
ncbi:flippase-like domain-containing protein [Nonomuraea ferruginea]